MEMVDMDITKLWFPGPKSRSVNILSASKIWMIVDVGFFILRQNTFLDVFDMYLVIFDINSQYLVRFSQYLVNILGQGPKTNRSEQSPLRQLCT